jgi:hypothetical protein
LQGGVFRTLNPRNSIDFTTHLVTADSLWSGFGEGLPRANVYDLHYNEADDVLLAATLGRGVWMLRNVKADPVHNVFTRSVLTLQSDGNITSPVNDQFRLVLNADNPLFLDVFVNNATDTPNLRVPLTALERIDVFGDGGEDVLTIDVSNGVISLPDVVRFLSGEPGAQANNFVVLEGGNLKAGTIIDGPVDGSGSIVILTANAFGPVIDFDGVAGITSNIDEEITNKPVVFANGLLFFGNWSRQLKAPAGLGKDLGPFGKTIARCSLAATTCPRKRPCPPRGRPPWPGGPVRARQRPDHPPAPRDRPGRPQPRNPGRAGDHGGRPRRPRRPR